MVGIPDGLGAFGNGDGTFTLLMNHELTAPSGSVRAHGSTGAFVSQWTIDKDTLQVLPGEDLIKHINLVSGTLPLARLCSADLPALSAFYNAATGKGYNGRLFMDGEENGTEGARTGACPRRHELEASGPRPLQLGELGRVPGDGGQDRHRRPRRFDARPGLRLRGRQGGRGSPVEKAGLTNGRLYGIKVTGVRAEPAGGIASGTPFTLFDLGHHDEDRFAPGAPNFLTQDEESSGVIPAPFLGEGSYLLDMQRTIRFRVRSWRAGSCSPCTSRPERSSGGQAVAAGPAAAAWVFSQTETCFVLSRVNGSRFQPPHRSRKVIPARRAIRSSSAGQT
jgi:hypothetical protein